MSPAHSFEADLIKAAIEIQKQAYAPYSDFHVGAAVLDENGTIHAGANVENSAYAGRTMCRSQRHRDNDCIWR